MLVVHWAQRTMIMTVMRRTNLSGYDGTCRVVLKVKKRTVIKTALLEILERLLSSLDMWVK